MGDGEQQGELLPGRNLILCADGTGNSAGKTNGTNVWRLYDALAHDGDPNDPDSPEQLAIHHDGVGTSSNAVLRVMGAAFGWGLASHVRELYAWLAQHYQGRTEDRDADQIYLFGFSRGAFTVRCLAGMIAHYGLPPSGQRSDPEELSREAWKSYKRHVQGGGRGEPPPQGNEKVRIRFLGVWDTVDAYGFPMDEVKDGIARGSQLVFRGPLSHLAWTRFSDNRPSPLIENVRHAMALDDERQTFHPLVFDESPNPKKPDARRTDILQLWFAGMHADVGGGYPRESLSYVPLLWMMQQAETAALRIDDSHDHRRPVTHLKFSEAKRKLIEDTQNPLGHLHDSRRGAGVFYRLQSRDTFKLHNQLVDAGIPKVHESVQTRMAQTRNLYLPQGLTRFSFWHKNGSETQMSVPEAHYGEVRRAHAHRRTLYILFLFSALAFALFPTLRDQAFGKRLETWATPEFGNFGIGHAFGWIAQAVPELVGSWIDAMRKEPFYLAFFLSVFLFMALLRGELLDRALAASGQAWARKKSLTPEEASAWQDSSPPEGTISLFRRKMVPNIVAFGTLLGILNLGLVLGGYGWNPLPSQDRSSLSVPTPLSNETLSFSTAHSTQSTHGYVEKDKEYIVHLEVDEPWFDDTLPATPDQGLRKTPLLLQATSAFKRSQKHNWFVLLQSVGSPLSELSAVESGKKWKATRSGKLNFFVNDATCYLCPGGPWTFYENNKGTASIRVEAVDAESSPKAQKDSAKPSPTKAQVNAAKPE